MIRHAPTAAVALSILVAVALVPAPAEAQLGGLARKARQAVQDRVEDRVEEALFVPPPPPEFTETVLEITEERALRMLDGFEAEVGYAKRASEDYRIRAAAFEDAMRDYDRAFEAYQPKDSTWQACAEDFRAREAETSAANEAKVEKVIEEMNDEEFDAYMEDLAIRGEQIAREAEANAQTMSPEMRARHVAYQQEVAAMLVEQNRRMGVVMAGYAAESRRAATEDPRLKEACGEAPVAPVRPLSELAGPEGMLAQVGAETAGLTAAQYAMMRERVLYWAAREGRPNRMGYSEGEMGALTTVRVRLDEVVERMRDAKVPL